MHRRRVPLAVPPNCYTASLARIASPRRVTQQRLHARGSVPYANDSTLVVKSKLAAYPLEKSGSLRRYGFRKDSCVVLLTTLTHLPHSLAPARFVAHSSSRL